jgi:hypothetical protein
MGLNEAKAIWLPHFPEIWSKGCGYWTQLLRIPKIKTPP